MTYAFFLFAIEHTFDTRLDANVTRWERTEHRATGGILQIKTARSLMWRHPWLGGSSGTHQWQGLQKGLEVLIYLALQMMTFQVRGRKVKRIMILSMFTSTACYKALLFTQICFFHFFICLFVYSARTPREALAFSPRVSMILEFSHMDYFAACSELACFWWIIGLCALWLLA